MSTDEELALSILRKHLATSWYALDDAGFLIDGNVTVTTEEADLICRLISELPPEPSLHEALVAKYGEKYNGHTA